MRTLFLQIISGILGLWIAVKSVSGVEFSGEIQFLFLAGTVLGLLNFFIKPILKAISFPLLLITFGLFSFVINMGMIWLVTIILPELVIEGILPLFLTALWVLGMSIVVSIFVPKIPKIQK